MLEMIEFSEVTTAVEELLTAPFDRLWMLIS